MASSQAEAAELIIAYVYSKSRSGETPVRVLADTMGKLLVDGYSAYNKVTVPGGRERAGRMAHLRRKFFDAAPEHLAMCQSRSKAVLEEFRAWLHAEQSRHLPNGPMGEAIKYAINQWAALTLFLSDPHLPVDNNASEAAQLPSRNCGPLRMGTQGSSMLVRPTGTQVFGQGHVDAGGGCAEKVSWSKFLLDRRRHRIRRML